MKRRPNSNSLQGGLTLIELLVAVVIGLVITLAVSNVVILGESHKRTTTSVNDVGQSGAYAAYAIDQAVRSAGSGFVQSTQPTDRGVFGCKLYVGSTLPRADAFPAPFEKFLSAAPSDLRMSPVLIGKSQSSDGNSDVLMVMGGYGGGGGISRPITDTGTATTLALDNTVGLAADDLAIVSQAGTTECLLEQVSSVATKVLTLGGKYYTAGPDSLISTLAASTSTYVTPLGNATANNVQMKLLGVGADSTLFSYDMLNDSGKDTVLAVADGVVRLRALYGLDVNGDGVVETWADPGVGDYAIDALMVAPDKIKLIRAVRVALVMRNSNYEKTEVAPSSLSWFNDAKDAANASLKQTLTLSGDDLHYRYRVIDSIIPLRNMLLLP